MTIKSEKGTQRGDLANALQEYTQPLNQDELAEAIGAFDPELQDVDVIAIGERSHGIRECFQTRQLLVQHLVENHGHRAVLCEMSLAAAAWLNDYIQRGEGTAEEALDANGVHMHWKSQSALEFVEWLREFNEGRDADDQVMLCGLDYQSGRPLARYIGEYLQRVDAGFHDEIADELAYFLDARVDLEGLYFHHDEVDPDEYVETWQALKPKVKARFEEHREEYIGRTSDEEYDRVSRAVDVFDHTAEFTYERWNLNAKAIYELRAEFLADALRWEFDRLDGEQVVVLAHNLHVRQGGFPESELGDISTMIDHFVEATATEVFSFGFSVGGGEFRVIDTAGDDQWDVVEIPEPSEGSVPGVLSATTDDSVVVDVDAAADDEVVGEWFEEKPEMFTLASRSDPDPVDTAKGDPRAFDGLVFCSEASPHVHL